MQEEWRVGHRENIIENGNEMTKCDIEYYCDEMVEDAEESPLETGFWELYGTYLFDGHNLSEKECMECYFSKEYL